jgi:arsenate reductase
VALLKEKGVDYSYREYTHHPLSVEELQGLFSNLGLRPKDLLRKRDKAYKQLGLTGKESDETLIHHMAEHPTILERPIGVLGKKAVVGRPPEKLLELAQ